MTDHPLVVALSEFLETHGMEAGLLIVPGDGELRLIGSGICPASLIGISKSLENYIVATYQPPADTKLN